MASSAFGRAPRARKEDEVAFVHSWCVELEERVKMQQAP